MFKENLSVFFDLAGHGVPVVAAGKTAVGILEMPDQVIGNGQILTTDYALWYKTADLVLATGTSITVNGTGYKVRDTKLHDDGAISIASLSKL